MPLGRHTVWSGPESEDVSVCGHVTKLPAIEIFLQWVCPTSIKPPESLPAVLNQ